MKRIIIAATAALAIAGCGSAKTAKIATNPQVTKDEAAAKQILAGCGVSTTTITAAEVRKYRKKAARKALSSCVVPAGHAPAFEACVLNTAKGSLSIKGINTAKAETGLTTCVEKNR